MERWPLHDLGLHLSRYISQSHLDLAVFGAGFVVINAEGHKTKKYQSLVASYIFVPITVETFGALG